jgi:hypothetical protein
MELENLKRRPKGASHLSGRLKTSSEDLSRSWEVTRRVPNPGRRTRDLLREITARNRHPRSERRLRATLGDTLGSRTHLNTIINSLRI